MSKQTFYVTTPIYYGTARPHLGSLYSTLLADVVNRWQKLQGSDTYFLTGTDEHGQKIMQAAKEAGKTPQEFVDSFIAAYKEVWNLYHIDYSQFIRTTDPYHIKGVQDLIVKLMDRGDIYKASYEGWYCTPCETYVTTQDKKAPPCPSCGRGTVAISEESYFFKLSAYADKLLAFYKENADFILPSERMNEVLSFVESGLKDLSISRTTISWGVPFPADSEHVVYVWVDALCNYITAIGYGDLDKKAMFEKWWPAQLHVLGKDIVRFHAVYWPALLMAADLALPKQLLVHGWIQIDKQKMSKSRGNVVDPIELAKLYEPEPVRYYLVRKMPVNSDGDFSTGDLEQTITSDLANDLGNLLNRMVSLATRNGLEQISAGDEWHEAAATLQKEAKVAFDAYGEHMEKYEFHLALARLWKFINQTNAYFHEQEPWKLAKADQKLFGEVISATCHSLRMIGVLLLPIMPEKMSALLQSIGVALNEQDTLTSLQLTTWNQPFTLTKIPTLFQKLEDSKGQKPMIEKKEDLSAGALAQAEEKTYATIDDVIKVELRVGTITQAEIIPESEKLLKFQVDFGELGTRQILAGVRKFYEPDQFVGKQGVFVFNLKPRKMVGMESQGMMLVAKDDDGKPIMVTVPSTVPNGTRLS